MDFQLTNKVAFVTGGSRGIGRAVALMLADHGANVAICGRRLDSLEQTVADLKAKGAQAWGFQTDVSRTEEIERFVADAAEAAGRIDVLVNNAVTSTSAPFDELTDDEFRYHIDVKLMAYIRMARQVLPHMEKLGRGRIVNIGGMTARIVAPLRMTNGVTNAGVANFTKQFSSYAARHNVTVNCVHPGYTATERVMQIFEREAADAGADIDTIVTERTADMPLGKLIAPEDIAQAVLFFCSPMADMVTGQSIAVDGGFGQAVVY
ncbi:MAG: SDR family oxidoreductase [Rhodospirillaceae bacterium]|jgi:3-oxoacyl-[acyl-carrier protein] reductase|nr:SDR family oxidoreductase [Rhodospirillaceae bacterium]